MGFTALLLEHDEIVLSKNLELPRYLRMPLRGPFDSLDLSASLWHVGNQLEADFFLLSHDMGWGRGRTKVIGETQPPRPVKEQGLPAFLPPGYTTGPTDLGGGVCFAVLPLTA